MENINTLFVVSMVIAAVDFTLLWYHHTLMKRHEK